MTRDPRHDILFEPVTIGPVTAPNRFYQVPHCSGMGFARPHTLAAMRATKAEGGWGVVCTEYCSIHATSDDVPYPYATLWDDDDVRNLALLADGVHEHGSLAGVELWHGGSYVANLLSREPTLGVRSMPSRTDPVQSKPMDRGDIAALRQWHRAAARRAVEAGFDIVYVYPSHGYLLSEFLSRSLNDRSDDYGGSLENRVRLVREIIEDTREAVAGRAAVAVRFSANGHGEDHLSADEARDMVGMLAELPDLWDLVVSDYSLEMGSSRFVKEGALEDAVSWVKTVTSRPVVGVGRFTTPDTMAGQVRRGVLDLVGAARPSIADPFLPAKIRDGALDDIRECIGCNICYSGNSRGAPIRCTQNPTMGEEWRRRWHPERIARDGSGSVLVVGAGPAGLEAAHVLGKRGFAVALADAAREPGGRVTRESRLPGLSEWARVRDYRLVQIGKLDTVTFYPESLMTAGDVLAFGAEHVVIATGALWRRNGLGRWHDLPVARFAHESVLTPDDIMDGRLPDGPTVVFDDDHYYMGPVIAELLAGKGLVVTYVTTEGKAGAWSTYTEEQARTQARMIAVGVDVVSCTAVTDFDGSRVELACIYSGMTRTVAATSIVTVTSREPRTDLSRDLERAVGTGQMSDFPAISRAGDCVQPSIIAAAVYAGHRAGRQVGRSPESVSPLRDRVVAGKKRKKVFPFPDHLIN